MVVGGAESMRYNGRYRPALIECLGKYGRILDELQLWYDLDQNRDLAGSKIDNEVQRLDIL